VVDPAVDLRVVVRVELRVVDPAVDLRVVVRVELRVE